MATARDAGTHWQEYVLVGVVDVLAQRLQHDLRHLASDPGLTLCAQLEAAQLNGELERGQRQVADVGRTFRRLKQSYEERKKGEKDLMDQTRNEFNQYFGLCAPPLNAP